MIIHSVRVKQSSFFLCYIFRRKAVNRFDNLSFIEAQVISALVLCYVPTYTMSITDHQLSPSLLHHC